MNSIVSATTSSIAGSGMRVGRRETFLSAAYELLAQAREEYDRGAFDLALESAYRAALRVAGAVNSVSPVIRKRKRLPTSAWERLALTSDSGKDWATSFAAFSALRGRVASGIETDPNPETVRALMELAEDFLGEAIPGMGKVPQMA